MRMSASVDADGLSSECELESKSSLLVVVCTDSSAVQQYGVLHYGEPESGAAHLARASFVYAVEAFEDA